MKNSNKMLGNLLLLITAVVWGFAFVAQSVAMDSVGPWTFVFSRFIIGGIVLMPVTRFSQKIYKASNPEEGKEKKKPSVTGGMCCGILLGLASIAQQLGIMTTSVGKAGFITALYIIMVPILGIFLGKKTSGRIWISAVCSIIGLYLLSMQPGNALRIEKGDLMVILCALLFSFQIMSVDHFSVRMNPVVLANQQFFFAALVGFVGMLFFEKPTMEGLMGAAVPILYAGIGSSAVGYTLQVVGQRMTDPTVASLLMSMESVFSALAGWLLLHQVLSGRELLGCCIMFAAVILAQLPEKRKEDVSRETF